MTTLTKPFVTFQLLTARTTKRTTTTTKRIFNNICFRQNTIINTSTHRSFSSLKASSHHDKQNNRLYICLSSSDDGEHQVPSRIITPLSNILLNESNNKKESDDNDDNEASPERLSEIIDRHYYDSESFVGGMGEGDGGVWFTPHPLSPWRVEPLLSWQLIRDTIRITKDHRHGVPFGVYTSGLGHLFDDKENDGVELASRLKVDLGLSSCEVSLGGAYDPPSYRRLMYHTKGSDDDAAADAMRCFGSVCQFIVATSESGFPIGVSVVDGGSGMMARELALSLGAVTVVSYPELKG